MVKQKKDRISLSLDITELRSRLETQVRTPGQSLSSVIRMCAILGLELLEALDARNIPIPRPGQLGALLDQLSAATQSLPRSIPELLEPVDLEEFSQMSRIPMETLQAYASGEEKPCDRDLVIMGAFLKKPDGSRWETTELMTLCDRNKPIHAEGETANGC